MEDSSNNSDKNDKYYIVREVVTSGHHCVSCGVVAEKNWIFCPVCGERFVQRFVQY